ncbi:MAG: hypothetical protein J2P53_05965 [Bradyrhizobiaceae bacterium]|nr:hypothetical protein [Bradyrhizobiaceae bacterium]
MPQKSRNPKFSRFARCAACAIALLFAGSVAVHAEDDGSEGPYKKFFNNLLSGVGLRDQDPGIEYKERPPLVVPPSRDLPVPTTARSPAAKNPDWPTDADGKRRSAGRKPKTTDGSVLAGAKADDPTPQEGTTRQSSSGGIWSSFTDWGRTLSGSGETGQFRGEPTRNALTDPPAGYRTPAPTEPYGILSSKEKKSGVDRQAETVNGLPK